MFSSSATGLDFFRGMDEDEDADEDEERSRSVRSVGGRDWIGLVVGERGEGRELQSSTRNSAAQLCMYVLYLPRSASSVRGDDWTPPYGIWPPGPSISNRSARCGLVN